MGFRVWSLHLRTVPLQSSISIKMLYLACNHKAYPNQQFWGHILTSRSLSWKKSLVLKNAKKRVHFFVVLVRYLNTSAGEAYLSGELLKSSYVDGAFLGCIQVTSTHTQVAGRAHHTTGQPQRVVWEYLLSWTIVILQVYMWRGIQ